MNYRILVVEDDDVIAGAVASHISSWGCEVRRATNYADVMADFNEFDPQLVPVFVRGMREGRIQMAGEVIGGR